MALFKGANFDSLKKKATEGIQMAQEKAQDPEFRESLRKAADAVASKADGAAKAFGESMKDFDAAQAARTVAGAASSGLAAASRAIGGAAEDEVEAAHDGEAALIGLLCCLSASDGEVSAAEREKMLAVASDLPASSGEESYGESLVQKAILDLEKDAREFDYPVAAKVGAQRILEGLTLSEQEKRSLGWNMYALAYADSITDAELDFIRFVGEKAGMNASVLEELGAYAAAIADVSAEKAKLQSVDRSYREIEPLVAELSEREQVLLGAAWALVLDGEN